jgi:hypothetical protein
MRKEFEADGVMYSYAVAVHGGYNEGMTQRVEVFDAAGEWVGGKDDSMVYGGDPTSRGYPITSMDTTALLIAHEIVREHLSRAG